MDVQDHIRGASFCSSHTPKLRELWCAELISVQVICLPVPLSMILGLKGDMADLLVMVVASQRQMLAVVVR
jgi:hypothetical protein